jgi:DNA polymerase III psi subunit
MEINPVLFDTLFTEELFSVSPPVTVIIDRPWETISPPERALLEKILAAIKQTLVSISIKYQGTLDLTLLVAKPCHVIYFGKPVKGIPLYESVEANGVRIVTSEGLPELSVNEEARKKLWQALKKQFAI